MLSILHILYMIIVSLFGAYTKSNTFTGGINDVRVKLHWTLLEQETVCFTPLKVVNL